MTTNNITQINWKPTRHRAGKKSSLLDIFLTTCPNRNDGCHYVPNSLSEHEAVLVDLFTEDSQIKEQFYLKSNQENITWNKLEPMIAESSLLNSLFSTNDTDVIANSILGETSKILDTLAPVKRVQIKKLDKDNMSPETRELKGLLNIQIT